MNKLSTSDYIKNTSKEYAIYVCENRSIPKVNDGLKDAQRKALWLLRKKTDKIKVVSLGGEMISSNLYLHGDASANDTISKLGAPFLNNIPLIKGVGQFGTRVAPVKGIGAPRYIYCKKYKATELLIYPDLDIVPLKENYDGSTVEPETFLPIIPMVLLNGISGIAVGWATEILPRTIDDLINATISCIDGKKIKRITPKYDYLNLDIKHGGGNSWEFKGKVEKVDASTVKVIELPPDLTLDKFKTRLVQYEEDGKIRDWVDRSTKEINIEIKFKRGAIRTWSDEKIINFFKISTKKTERIVVIDWNGDAIRQYGSAEELIKDFVEWRFKFYIKRYENLLHKTKEELKYWRALKMCFDSNLPGKLVKMKNRQEIADEVNNITKTLKLTNEEIDRIVSVPTYNWAQDRYQYIVEKIKDLTDLETEYQDLLDNPDKIKSIFKTEVMNLKKEKFQ